ncbi:redoxin family protein [Sphingobacterium sp. lm-10]|uniref:TlpA family protein disulfide reductase n=1 Tax=Sphingobacterium sp. lm-10 TaxID=2944904 RepID=UPI0020209DED|nr:thioredoxin-like domain-containing protein [Sphingobacterium sp. lm-10]MCL7987930.1 redoxin family protein [Sphingobacterium sp. lm-10]
MTHIVSLLCSAQTAVIKGEFEGTNVSSILIGIPIDGQFYNRDMKTSHPLKKQDKTFRKEIILTSPALIPIEVGQLYGEFYLEPGKELDLRIVNSNGKKLLTDRGVFAKGNGLLNEVIESLYKKSFEKRRYIQLARHAERFYEKPVREQSLFLDSCKQFHQEVLQSWNKIHGTGGLSDKQYQLGYAALTNRALVFPLFIFVNNIKTFDQLSKSERQMFFYTADGITDMFGSIEGWFTGIDLSSFLFNYTLILARRDTAEITNDFSSINKQLARYAKLPAPFDRWRIAQSIKGNFKSGFEQYSYQDVMAIYEKHYPKDGLYFMLDSLHKVAEGKRIRYTDGFGLYPDSLSTYKFYYENGLPTVGYVANFSSFESVLATSSRSKAIFVDLWATWCEPCIKQFAHSKELNRRLRERDIFTVYVSIDAADKRDVWEYTARGHALEGSHVLLSPELKKELKQKYKLNTIPRYMLATADGRVLIPDASASPSDMDALMNEIDAFLKTE